MENKNPPTSPGDENQANKETPDKKKIRVARESRSVLKQIDKLEREIASEQRKLEAKEAKLASLVDRL